MKKDDKPNKGWIKELESKVPNKPLPVPNTEFTWKDSVVGPARIKGMKTEKKLNKLTPSIDTKNSFVKEARKFIENRRKK